MPITKKRLLDHLENESFVRSQKSSTHGVGVFAIRDIPKGENPFRFLLPEEYIEFNKDELEHLPKEIKKMIHDYCAEEEGKVWIPKYGFNTLQNVRFLNHSTTPNLKTTDDGTTFVTIRKIKKGEELFSNYEHYDENYIEKM